MKEDLVKIRSRAERSPPSAGQEYKERAISEGTGTGAIHPGRTGIQPFRAQISAEY